MSAVGTFTASAVRPAPTACDICSHAIEPGERYSDDGSEVAHTSCVRDWFRRNFGREGLA